MSGLYNLERFKKAQDSIYHRVINELKQAHKQSHWMWYIFPQIEGLGQSVIAKTYAIKNKAEATAYLEEPLLAGRLDECCEILLSFKDKKIVDILGYPDNLKLRSSMTLFASISKKNSLYNQVLERYFDGQADPLTLAKLAD